MTSQSFTKDRSAGLSSVWPLVRATWGLLVTGEGSLVGSRQYPLMLTFGCLRSC